MKLYSITNQNSNSFRAKLPSKACQLPIDSLGLTRDCWSDFARECHREGKLSKLAEKLYQLDKYGDDGILALNKFQESNFVFGLFSSQKDLDKARRVGTISAFQKHSKPDSCVWFESRGNTTVKRDLETGREIKEFSKDESSFVDTLITTIDKYIHFPTKRFNNLKPEDIDDFRIL